MRDISSWVILHQALGHFIGSIKSGGEEAISTSGSKDMMPELPGHRDQHATKTFSASSLTVGVQPTRKLSRPDSSCNYKPVGAAVVLVISANF
jgi:hypothetical protein